MSIIEISNLSKKYIVKKCGQSPHTFKESIVHWLRNLKHAFHSKKSDPTLNEFWALKDLSVSVQEGDRIGLIGKNGSGKSTLLKLLSRITDPTTGKLKIKGRVSCLLEVGTGFHPDLTGRENILFSGALMGMSYREIQRKFDEIVSFANIEAFIDTPVKRYSSGMFLRLGFSVAAHLDSEILVIDEALAVGDLQFQEKCMKKMNDLGSSGRTIIYVSHDIDSVLALCNKGIVLNQGKLVASGEIGECVQHYLQYCFPVGNTWQGNLGDDHMRIYHFSMTQPQFNSQYYLPHEKADLEIEIEIMKPHPLFTLGFTLFNSRHHVVARSHVTDHPKYLKMMQQPGKLTLNFPIDLALFHPGDYQVRIDCSLHNQKRILNDEVSIKFSVISEETPQASRALLAKDGLSLGNRWRQK